MKVKDKSPIYRFNASCFMYEVYSCDALKCSFFSCFLHGNHINSVHFLYCISLLHRHDKFPWYAIEVRKAEKKINFWKYFEVSIVNVIKYSFTHFFFILYLTIKNSGKFIVDSWTFNNRIKFVLLVILALNDYFSVFNVSYHCNAFT